MEAAVLIVDDLPANLLALETALAPLRARLVRAGSGREALKHLLHEEFACILLDVQMPEMDGFETAKLIKARESTKHIPILFITALDSDPVNVSHGYEQGAVDYIVKPYEPAALRAKVKAFVDLYDRQKKLREHDREQSDFEKASLQAQLELVTDAVPVLISFIDRDERYRFVNKAYEDWFGVKRADVLGRTMREFIGDKAHAAVAPILERVKQGEAIEVERTLEYRLGGTREVNAHYVPMRNRAGEVDGMVGLVADISGRKRTEERLRISERRFAAMFHKAALPTALIDIPSTKFVDVNGAFCRLLELEREAAIGRSAVELGLIDDLKVRERRIEELLKNGALRNTEHQLRTRTGRPLVVITNAETFELEGQRFALVTLTDVTQQRELEESLAFTLQAGGLGHLQLDLATGQLEASEACRAAFGVERTEDLCSWPQLRNRIHEDDRDSVSAQLSQALQGVDDFHSEFRIVSTPETPDRWVLIQGRARRAADGEPVSMACITLDISERMQLLEELRNAVEVRDEFLSIASHELKTPLTPLLLRLQKLELEASKQPASKFVETVRQSAENGRRALKRLQSLVDDLLDVSRVATGQLHFSYEQVDLARLATDVAAVFLPEAERSGSSISVDAPHGVVGFWDRLRIEQVITNLLSNAIKYGARAPIAVTVSSHDGLASLIVADRGIGIDPKVLPHIFEKFERGVSDRNYGGLGLGLYLTRQIVERHGGRVHAESTLGHGSRFIVSLPQEPPSGPAPTSLH